MDGGTRARVGHFIDETIEREFRAAYATAMTLWPPHDTIDVETDFGTTRIYRHGVATGEPIVLVHGHGANASTWYHQITGLGRHHPVYAIDTIDDPGGSRQRRPVTGSDDAAAWLSEVLAGLGLTRVHLAGLSYGGWLVLNQAVHRPERLASVTLLDPGGLEKVPVRFMLSLFATVLAIRLPTSWKPLLARLLAEHSLVERPEIMNPVLLGVHAFRPHRSPARRFTDDELHRVTVPTQLILARRTKLFRPDQALARARRLLPLEHAEIVPGIGHGIPLEAPELVTDRILGFADRTAGQS
ncbi:alpha/beta fold hydrolase [Streptosporangium sp. NPDC001681]|uniref:alpha/beta fold hydrolase n=1 Tax=Streptosporangium sp. NPDC001681 TaxID=3154395 RepID=UPI00332B64C5